MSSSNQSATSDAFSLDHKALIRSFARAAAHGASSRTSLQRLNAELIERLHYFALKPDCVVDLGAGTCGASLQLRDLYRRAQVVAVDFTPAMLECAPRSWWPRSRFHRVAADATQLPFAARTVDLVYSNLLLPFCDRPDRAFREIARVLKAGGLFVFSTLGPETLKELRQAWASVDHGAHVSLFPNLPQLGNALMHSGLAEPVMDTEQHLIHYSEVPTLVRELKQDGAQNAVSTRTRGLTGRARWAAMIKAYESARTPAGIPATYEVIFGAAFAGTPIESRVEPQGTDIAIPIGSIRKPVRR